jgi:D-serine deaminase-like pyridoxal phosphate-dependent protein
VIAVDTPAVVVERVREARRRHAGGSGVAGGAAVARQDALRFGGFATYPVPGGALEFLAEACRLAQQRGLEVETVSAGGTPSCGRRASCDRP